MKKLLVLALALGMVGGFALAALAVNAPASIPLEVTGKGSVTFDHALHQGRVNGCKQCHHMGVGNGSCAGCHGVAPQAPALADALAKNCAGCHEETSVPEAEPAASCSDYSERDECAADPDCRWSRWRKQCRDGR